MARSLRLLRSRHLVGRRPLTSRLPALASITQWVALLIGSYSLAKLVVFAGFNIDWFVRFRSLLVPSTWSEIAYYLLIAAASYGLFRAADALHAAGSLGAPSNLESRF